MRRRRRELWRRDGFADAQVWWVCLSVCPGAARRERPAVRGAACPSASLGGGSPSALHKHVPQTGTAERGRGSAPPREPPGHGVLGGSVGRMWVFKAPSDNGARHSGAHVLSVRVTRGPCLAPEAGSVGRPSPGEAQPGWGVPGDPGTLAARAGTLSGFHWAVLSVGLAAHRNLSVLRAVSASQACTGSGSDAVFLGRRMSWCCPRAVAVGLGLRPLPCRRVSAGGGGSVPLPTLRFILFPVGQAREDPSPLLTRGAVLLQAVGETAMPEYTAGRTNASPHLCLDSLFFTSSAAVGSAYGAFGGWRS